MTQTKTLRIVIGIAAVLLLLGVVMAGAVSADDSSAVDDSSAAVTDDGWTTVTDEKSLKKAVAAGGNVKLGKTISMSSQLDIKNKVVLDLNGCELRFRHKEHIYVAPGGDLTIDDSSNPSTGKIMGGKSNGNGGCIYVNDHANLTLNKGTIQDGNCRHYGAGVFVNSYSTFTMNGGTITNNTTDATQYVGNGYGGGVAVKGDGAKFIMNGGAITGNKITNFDDGHGAGVYVGEGAEFTMTGKQKCIISDNNSNPTGKGNGGGVYVEKNGTFTMGGNSIISNNTTDNYGGGVYVVKDGKFTMNGGTISNNLVEFDDGAGVCVKGEFTMNGGRIEYNHTKGYDSYGTEKKAYGGGVYVQGGTFTMTNGVITNNVALSNGGGVLVCDKGTITVSGSSSITGNTKCKAYNKISSNICLDSGGTLTLDGNLSGKIGIGNSNPQEGAEFGMATSKASGAENILSDEGNLCGKIDGGKLVWTNANEGGSSSLSGALTADVTTTTAAKSPVPVFGILSGLGVGVMLLRRR